jgi:Domain of unknown function (DUF4398)
MGGGEHSVSGQEIRRRAAACLTAGGLAVAALAGCAQAPVPKAALDAAELAVAQARNAGAERDAPSELEHAEQKLEAARAALRAKAHDHARTFAEQALVDAELAEVKAQAAQAQAIASQLRQQVDHQPRRMARDGRGA